MISVNKSDFDRWMRSALDRITVDDLCTQPKIEALAFIFVGEKLGFLTYEESKGLSKEIDKRNQRRVVITGGKYSGEKGKIHFLNLRDTPDNSRSATVVLDSDFGSVKRKLSWDFVKEESYVSN